MNYTLEKYAEPEVSLPRGGRVAVGSTNGLPGYNPQNLTGFYPTAAYLAVREFVDGEGRTVLHPEEYLNFRLNSELLTQIPDMSQEAITQVIENRMRGQFDRHYPHVFLSAAFNVWNPEWPHPTVDNEAGSYVQRIEDAWNAGAVTFGCFARAGRLTFTAGVETHAAVGLSGADADQRDPHTMDHGFLIRGPLAVQAIERGEVLSLTASVFPGDSTTFVIEIVDDVVKYLVNGTVRLTTSAGLHRRAVYQGHACLYGASSKVAGASVMAYSGGTVQLPALQTRYNGAGLTLPSPVVESGWFPYAAVRMPALRALGAEAQYAYAETRLPALVAGGARQGQGMRLPKLAMVGGNYASAKLRLRLTARGSNYVYASGTARLPALNAESLTGRPRPLGAILRLPRLRGISTGSTPGTGQGAAVLPRLTARSAYYSQGAVALPKLVGLAYTDPPQEAFISGAPFAAGALTASRLVLLTMDSAGTLTSALAVNLTRTAEAISGAVITDAAVISAVMHALMESSIVGASFTSLFEQEGTTWVVNADTMATSRYENFAFNSFGTVGGRAYGVRSDGVYLLAGDTDAGHPIQASLNFGSLTLGTRQLKRLEHVYLGVSSSGALFLKVTADGASYVYKTRRSSEHTAIQRVDVGRGLRASYMEFELFNEDGGDFELETVSFYAAELTRRI